MLDKEKRKPAVRVGQLVRVRSPNHSTSFTGTVQDIYRDDFKRWNVVVTSEYGACIYTSDEVTPEPS